MEEWKAISLASFFYSKISCTLFHLLLYVMNLKLIVNTVSKKLNKILN